MAHSKKKQILKIKRKLSVEDKITKIKGKNKLKSINLVNRYIDELKDSVESKIAYFLKHLKNLGNKINKMQLQEEKAAKRLMAIEKKAVESNIPAAKKRMKEVKLVVLNIKKENNSLQKELTLAENNLNEFKDELRKLKMLKKTVTDFHKEDKFLMAKGNQPVKTSSNKKEEDDIPIFDKAFEVNPKDIVDDPIHKNFSDDFDLEMDVLTEGGYIRRKNKKLDIYSDDLLIEESRARGELSDEALES